jgi:hypothetical protein
VKDVLFVKLIFDTHILKVEDKLYTLQIVVKPSGPKYLGSVGISFHSASNVTSIIEAADDLLQEIDEGSSVLIEEFIEPISPRNTGKFIKCCFFFLEKYSITHNEKEEKNII